LEAAWPQSAVAVKTPLFQAIAGALTCEHYTSQSMDGNAKWIIVTKFGIDSAIHHDGCRERLGQTRQWESAGSQTPTCYSP